MIIDLVKLNQGLTEQIEINEEIIIEQSKLKGTDVSSISPVKVEGWIVKKSYDDYYLSFNIECNTIIPCAITLKPLDYPINVEIEGYFSDFQEEIDKNMKISQNSLDILPIIWENILMEIPMKLVSSDIQELAEDEIKNDSSEKKELNPELQKLKDLL